MFDREESAKRAERYERYNPPGMCQLWTRTVFGAPSAGDRDHDGDADAVDGWRSEPSAHRHPGDKRPPRGVPVSFAGGSSGHGHRAVSLGKGRIKSTDVTGSNYTPGAVGVTTIAGIEKVLKVSYLGWSNTITGRMIPMPPPPSRGARVDEALQKLRRSRRRSKTEKRTSLLTRAINALKRIKPTR